MRHLIFTILSLILITTSAYAVPYLQLDIIAPDRFYNENSDPDIDVDTIATYTKEFKLIALIKDDYRNAGAYGQELTFNVVAALTPQSSGSSLGTFSFDNQLIRVTEDMIYGTPPESEATSEDLPSHGIYDTWFKEFSFNFEDTRLDITDEYDVQFSDTPLPDLDTRKLLSYISFDIDVNDIAMGYGIHFDFYAVDGEGNRVAFAPFSHDAEVGHTPEPGTLMLLGFGMLGLAGIGRGKQKV